MRKAGSAAGGRAGVDCTARDSTLVVGQHRLRGPDPGVARRGPGIAMVAIGPDQLQGREVIPVVVPAGRAQVFIVLRSRHGTKGAVVTFEDVVVVPAYAVHPAVSHSRPRRVEHEMHGVGRQAEDDELGMLEAPKETYGEGEAGTLVIDRKSV